MIHTRTLFFIGLGLCLLTAFATLRAIPLGLEVAFADMMPHITLRRLAFLLHIGGASVALATGGFQLWDGLRQRHLNWHRWNGRVYVVAVLCGGISGFWLGLSALGGPVAVVGFVLLAIIWCIFTILAVLRIRSGDVQAHRAWMYRSFALTFAAVTLRLQLMVFVFAGVGYAEASVWLAWISWVPNLLWVEWKLRQA